MAIRKCHICHTQPADWVWQPFGPSEDYRCFTAPGWQYRGFPTLSVCNDCKQKIMDPARETPHGLITFEYRGTTYAISSHGLTESPF